MIASYKLKRGSIIVLTPSVGQRCGIPAEYRILHVRTLPKRAAMEGYEKVYQLIAVHPEDEEIRVLYFAERTGIIEYFRESLGEKPPGGHSAWHAAKEL